MRAINPGGESLIKPAVGALRLRRSRWGYETGEDAIRSRPVLISSATPPDERASPDHYGAGDVSWLVASPRKHQAALALAHACTAKLDESEMRRQWADGALPTPATFGIPAAWPHVRTVMEAAGFSDDEGRTETMLAGDFTSPRLDGGTRARRAAHRDGGLPRRACPRRSDSASSAMPCRGSASGAPPAYSPWAEELDAGSLAFLSSSAGMRSKDPSRVTTRHEGSSIPAPTLHSWNPMSDRRPRPSDDLAWSLASGNPTRIPAIVIVCYRPLGGHPAGVYVTLPDQGIVGILRNPLSGRVAIRSDQLGMRPLGPVWSGGTRNPDLLCGPIEMAGNQDGMTSRVA